MDHPTEDLYSPARVVGSVRECCFYHTMDLPGVGVVTGSWDLRPGVGDYLGHLPLVGKRVLEIGTASGYLCFEMERRGAEVVAFDLSERTPAWDMVPFGGAPPRGATTERTQGMRLINNAYWFAHRALGSKARVVYGSVYDLPAAIGQVDVAVFGAVLLHLRDPFLALERALSLATESVIVTEPASRLVRAAQRLPGRAHLRLVSSRHLPATMGFMPDPATHQPSETWWRLPPWTVTRMLGVLGFDVERVIFHRASFQGRPCPLYTLVGRRRAGLTPSGGPRPRGTSRGPTAPSPGDDGTGPDR